LKLFNPEILDQLDFCINLFGELLLNFVERFALGLRNSEKDKDGADHADSGEHPESGRRAERVEQVLERLGHEEHQDVVLDAGERAGAALDLGREQLAQHGPGDRPEAQREHDDEEDDGGQRDQAVRGHVHPCVQKVEVHAQNGQAQCHHARTQHQQHAPPSPT
jgi:hypothetical protein